MKKIIICLFIILNIVFMTASSNAVANEGYELVKSENVTHFFTHSLIAYPEIAFAKNNEMRNAYDADCVTVSEFKAFLAELYSRNYVLINLADTYTKEGAAKTKRVKTPKGKKPLVLSFDDFNYYKKKMHLGMCDKLIVKDGRLATFTKNAETQINFDNEHVTIVENFINEHPDFSYNNAKGVICLTGFDGILGYRTSGDFIERTAEIEKVKPVVEMLKKKGWKFACHGYGHYHMKRISEQAFSRDTNKWLAEVGILVGKTDIYCYPYGEWEIGDESGLSAKQKSLNDSGFRLYLGVGEKNFFGKLPYSSKATETILLMDRKSFDGISLRGLAKAYAPYMNCLKVYDSKQRFLPFKNK